MQANSTLAMPNGLPHALPVLWRVVVDEEVVMNFPPLHDHGGLLGITSVQFPDSSCGGLILPRSRQKQGPWYMFGERTATVFSNIITKD